MRVIVPRDTKSAKEFVQKSMLDWLNKHADRKDAPYKIIIPPTGIVPEFAALNAVAGAATATASASGGGEDTQQADTAAAVDGAGTFSGKNKNTETIVTSKGGMIGGSSGFGQGAPGGDANSPGGPSDSGSGNKTEAKQDRKASRVAIKSSAAEPVDIDRDASLPLAPNAYVGKAATTVVIKFTVELRPPVGRELAPAAAPAEGEPAADGSEGGQP
ncbi:MAG: hypothetical protein RI986_636 [Planctomycetota bacterium]|jgi:hypothetical protein